VSVVDAGPSAVSVVDAVPSAVSVVDAGKLVTTDRIRLRYRFAGIPRTRTIKLHELAVSLAAPPTCGADSLPWSIPPSGGGGVGGSAG
jgi:hypothetical protein